MANVSVAIVGANERAVVDDHRERRLDFLRDRKSKIVTAAGDQGDFDAAAGSFGDGYTVSLRDLPAAVQKGAVDIQGNEANRHRSIIAWNGAISGVGGAGGGVNGSQI